MFHTQTLHRALAATAAALVTLSFTAGPAFASPDPGPPLVTATVEPTAGDLDRCTLARVGDQYVACDNLTGNGVQAPAWVPER